ncbi:MAG: SEC-C metal-binding domain-containing protein [Clostridia bacterium]
MALNKEWQDLAQQERTAEAQEKFWSDYFEKETEAYRQILTDKSGRLTGTPTEFAGKFKMETVEMAGFLDGINTSLAIEVDLDQLTADSTLDLTIDFEKLYYNMLNAKAPWLYGLEEWDGVLSEEKRHEITKKFKTDHIFVRTETIGRNDPCPCGSGKKYKKCCGTNK